MDTARREVLTVKELAELIGVTPNTIYRHAASGSIPTVRPGRIRRVLFPRNVIERMLREGAYEAAVASPEASRSVMGQVAA
jgi:excisionase family DNA binding protein